MKRLMIFILSFGAVTSLRAATVSGADFLKIPTEARGIAMGQAFSAIASETDALSWNVAGIAPASQGVSAGRLSLTHQELFYGNKLDHIAVTKSIGNSGFGLSVTRLGYPSQESRDENRNVTGSFGAQDLAAGLAYAYNYRGLRMGTQFRFLQQKISNQSASGFAADFGIQSVTPIQRLSLGASVRNLGPSMQFNSEKFSLPLEFSVGGAYRVVGPLIASVELLRRPYDGQTAVSIGSEFSATGSFSLRAGYVAKLASVVQNNQQSETNRGVAGGISGMNAGFGLKFSSIVLDYAMTPFGELGDVQTLTLSSSFGRGHEITAPTKAPSDLSDQSGRTIVIFEKSTSEQPWWSGK